MPLSHPRVIAFALASMAAASVSCSSSSGGATTDGGTSPSGGDSSTKKGGHDSGPGNPGVDSSPPPPATDGGAVGGVPGGVIGIGTTIASCMIFPPDNPWNVAIDGTAVEVIHSYDSQLQQGTSLHPDFGGYTTDNGGIPFNAVPASQAEEAIDFTLYASESDPGPGGWVGPNPVTGNADMGATKWPFFVGMKIEGDPPAGGTPGNLPGDQHGIALQAGASGCVLYEAWNCAVVSAPPFQCANGAVFDLTSNTLRTAGWTSADAAGLPIFPGLVKLKEVLAGQVTHAVRMTFNATQNGYIPPATHAASSNPLGSAYPPMGLRMRLKASVSTASYTTASQVIMAGMKKYGLIVADNGSDWYFQGDSDDGWTAMAPDGQDTIIDEVVGDFRDLTGGDFEAVYTGDPVSTGL